MDQLILPEEEGEVEEEKESEDIEDLRPWVSDVDVLFDGDPCTLDLRVKRVKSGEVE